jgi:glycerate kinase
MIRIGKITDFDLKFLMSKTPPCILIAPACLKGSLSAMKAAACIADFLKARVPDAVHLDICPIADGGDDTLDVLQFADAKFIRHQAPVTGSVPDMTVNAHYLVHPAKKLAVVEAAQAHGYQLLGPAGLSPMRATSYGVGELLKSVIQNTPDLEQIIVTLGGSASTDGGFGALQALGVGLLDASEKRIETPVGGGMLSEIHGIQWLERWDFSGRILLATDTLNPLLGPLGTATVFAPQKGATPQQCLELEQGLSHAGQQLSRVCDTDYTDLPGTGAAGGLAYGLRHLPRCGIISGSEWIAEALRLKERLKAASLVITAEGRLDFTSIQGKAIGHLLGEADNKPAFIFCGQVQEGMPLPSSVQVFPLADDAESGSVEFAMAHPEVALQRQLEAVWPRIAALLG